MNANPLEGLLPLADSALARGHSREIELRRAIAARVARRVGNRWYVAIDGETASAER